jgi:DinB superfamily
MTDFQYPVGKFERQIEYHPSEIAEFIGILEQLPSQMRAAVQGLSDSQLETPYRPDGWTLRQVVHHVPDSHMNSFVRFKLALTEENPTIKPYDEGAWALLSDSSLPVQVSLDLLEALHARWVILLRSIKPEAWKRTFQHPENGPMTLEYALALYAWHSRHHLAHITQTRASMGW